MKIYGLFLLLLVSCGGPTLPRSTYWLSRADVAVQDDVVRLWLAVEPEHADLSECSPEHVRVAVANDQEFVTLCSFCPPGLCPGYRASEACPYGCASECTIFHEASTSSHLRTYIVVHESVIPEGAGGPGWEPHLRHGLAHWLSRCAGGDEDRAHAGPIWEAIGFR